MSPGLRLVYPVEFRRGRSVPRRVSGMIRAMKLKQREVALTCRQTIRSTIREDPAKVHSLPSGGELFGAWPL